MAESFFDAGPNRSQWCFAKAMGALLYGSKRIVARRQALARLARAAEEEMPEAIAKAKTHRRFFAFSRDVAASQALSLQIRLSFLYVPVGGRQVPRRVCCLYAMKSHWLSPTGLSFLVTASRQHVCEFCGRPTQA